MKRPLRLLLVEDSSDDAELLLYELRHGGYEPQCVRVLSAEEMKCALQEQWDLVISDYVLPGFGGLEAFGLYREAGLDIPFIIISGHIGEEIAVAAIKAGAHDYVMKDRLTRLVPAIERALQEAEIRRAHARVQQELAVNTTQLELTVLELRSTEAQLRHTNAQLTKAGEQLESRVQERTADLTRANAELARQISERKRLENELLDAVENERRTIGFDLHDDVGQRLMGLSMLLKGIETKLKHNRSPEVAITAEANYLLSQIIEYTHDLPRCFSSIDCDAEKDLAALVKRLASNVRKAFQIRCKLRIAGALSDLPAETVLQLYKVTQEAVCNAVKQGKANQVLIAITRDPKELLLEIKDDGVPFQESGEVSLALRMMNYRAHTIDGLLSVGSNGHSGTAVRCQVPANGPAPAQPKVGRSVPVAVVANSASDPTGAVARKAPASCLPQRFS